MEEDSKESKSGAGEAKPPKIKAEENPWYLLATLYGVPTPLDYELVNKNRVAWNRYFAANLDEEERRKLIEDKQYPAEELTAFSSKELEGVATAFAERCGSTERLALPTRGADINFANVEFDQSVSFHRFVLQVCSFKGAIFSEDASFGRAIFHWADFDDAIFIGRASFMGATFERGSFVGAIFTELAAFEKTAFSQRADFGGAKFFSLANFGGVTFSSVTYSSFAILSGFACFDDATFSQVYFNGANFSCRTTFRQTTFGQTSRFANAEMRDKTSFEGAMFEREPPQFLGAKLHQDTVWRGITWPPKPKDKDEAGLFIDAYACLKLEMDRLKKHDDELNFFALELQSRRVLMGTWAGLPIAIYGAVSDYGRSYVLPLVALFYLGLIGTLGFLSSDVLSTWQALGLSFANALNVFGFRKDFFDPSRIACLPAWLDVVAAAQTILGTVLLFLFGLGIRNKFRMK